MPTFRLSLENCTPADFSRTGAVVCWGSDEQGQASPPYGIRFKFIASVVDRACGIRMDDAAACWGRDNHGPSSAPSGRFSAIVIEQHHTCCVRADGAVIFLGQKCLLPVNAAIAKTDDIEKIALAPAGAGKFGMKMA